MRLSKALATGCVARIRSVTLAGALSVRRLFAAFCSLAAVPLLKVQGVLPGLIRYHFPSKPDHHKSSVTGNKYMHG